MKTERLNTGKRQPNKWLLTSAVALTLGTVGLSTEVAHADASSDAEDTSSQTTSGQPTDKSVALKTKTVAPNKAADPQTPAGDEASKSQHDDNNENNNNNNDNNGGDQSHALNSKEDTGNTTTGDLDTHDDDKTVVTDQGQDEAGRAAIKPGVSGIQAEALKLDAPAATNIDDLMPDQNLQQLVLYAIQQDHPEITSTSQITPDLLAGLTKLNVDDRLGDAKQESDQAFYNAVTGVKSLAGLENAKNLQMLGISADNSAATKWGKRSGQLKDIAALGKLTNLTSVSLTDTQISDEDTKVLANLTNLTSLTLNNSHVTNLDFLANLTALTNIGFNKAADNPDKISDLSPLKKLVNLSTIQLANNDISDISVLRNITAIPENFGLSGNHIFDITPALSLNWQPFFDSDPYYNISASNQTWTLAPAVLNPGTQHLSTWSFAYDNLYNFNEFMSEGRAPGLGGASLPESADSYTIGASDWIVWRDFTKDDDAIHLNWEVLRHNGLWTPAPEGLSFDGMITIPYKLQADTGAVTVNFRLDGGVNIAPFVILSGQTGSSLDVLNDASVKQAIAALEDRGFAYEKPAKYSTDLTATTEDSNITYDSDAQNVTLLFSPLQKIYLVDENGQAIGQKLVKESGKTGTNWTTDIPTVDGYQFDRVDGAVTATDKTLSGTIQDYNPDITVYYKSTGKPVTPVDPDNPTPVTNGTVTVHYQTTTGDQLVASETLTGPLGQAYTTTAKKLKGYELVKTSSNAQGVYTAVNQDVYYTYRLIKKGSSGDQGDPTHQGSNGAKLTPTAKKKAQLLNGGGAGDHGQASPVTARGAQGARANGPKANAATAMTATASATTLPQTGERATSPWWGVAVLGVIGSLLGFKRRKRQ